jgi:tetratricopeptide (TPR) repeat protein
MIDDAIVVAGRSSAVYVAHASHNRAVLAAGRGDPTAALGHFDEALELWDAANLVPAEHYLEKAETFLALRLLPEADAAVGAALRDLDGRPGAALLFAEGLLLAADIANSRGDGARAVELNQRAAETFAAQNRPGWWALAEHGAIAARLANGAAATSDRAQMVRVEERLAQSGHNAAQVAAALTSARLARKSGDTTAARDAFRRSADLGRQGSALQRIQSWVAETELADMDGDGRRVSSSARAGLRTLDNYRSTFDAVELRAQAAGYGEGLGALGLNWATRTNRPERVWSWLERTRAAALVESPPLGDDHQTEVALGKLRATTALIAELEPDGSGIVEAQRDLAQAERELRTISWKRSRTQHDRAAGSEPTLGESPTTTTLERIQADLGTAGLVQYGIVDGTVLAVVVTDKRRSLLPLGPSDGTAKAGREMAFALRRLGRSSTPASADAASTAANAALGDLDDLLAGSPLQRALFSCQDVVIVPPSDMIGLPWASMGAFADRPVAVAPSATAWWVTTSRRPPVGSQVVALAGPRLQHAADEVRSVAAIHPNARSLVGADASGQALLDHVGGVVGGVGDVGTVHVAAHGRLRRDSPTFSSFELEDGPFTVHDVRRLPTAIQRWVLASCDLGSSGNLPGSDLEGIVAALFGAGAGAVVAAAVEVPDESTTKLMVALHQHLASGESTAPALYHARHELDPTDPNQRAVQMAFTCFGAG